jgi:RNA polymerase sigma-70 factor, ECF subfamily
MSVAAVIAQSWWAGAEGGGDGGRDRGGGGHGDRNVPAGHNVQQAETDAAGLSHATAADRACVARIRAGDSAEFDALVLRVFPLLSRVAARLAGSTADGEEIAQELLCRAWIQRETLPDAVPLTVYLLSAVRRRALNAIRDRQTAEQFQGELPGTMLSPATDADVIASERRAHILGALGALTPRHRLAVELRYGAVVSYAEVGAALGVSDRAAEQIVRRALAALRRALGEIDL